VVFCDSLFILVLGMEMVEIRMDVRVYERMGVEFWGKAPVGFLFIS